MKKIILIINWVWQFPQILLGYILILCFQAKKQLFACVDGMQISWYIFERKGRFSNFISGVSLAWIILLSVGDDNEQTIRHEWGHSKQSAYLGLFYLPFIGIFSVCFNLWNRCFHKNWPSVKRSKWYYSRWTEAWADRLGGVDRTFLQDNTQKNTVKQA